MLGHACNLEGDSDHTSMSTRFNAGPCATVTVPSPGQSRERPRASSASLAGWRAGCRASRWRRPCGEASAAATDATVAAATDCPCCQRAQGPSGGDAADAAFVQVMRCSHHLAVVSIGTVFGVRLAGASPRIRRCWLASYLRPCSEMAARRLLAAPAVSHSRCRFTLQSPCAQGLYLLLVTVRADHVWPRPRARPLWHGDFLKPLLPCISRDAMCCRVSIPGPAAGVMCGPVVRLSRLSSEHGVAVGGCYRCCGWSLARSCYSLMSARPDLLWRSLCVRVCWPLRHGA